VNRNDYNNEIKFIVSSKSKTNSSINSIQFKNNNIYSGCDDGTISVWNISNSNDKFEIKLLFTSEKIHELINSLQIKDDYIYTTGDNRRISVWKIDKYDNNDNVKLISTNKNKVDGIINTF